MEKATARWPFFLAPWWSNYINKKSRPNRSGFSLRREKPKISSQP